MARLAPPVSTRRLVTGDPRPARVPGPRRARRVGHLRPNFEHALRDPADLDLLGALGDPVPAVVAVDVLEGFVPAVADAAVDLHRPVGGLARQPVGAVVGHRHLVRDLHVVIAVQMPGGVVAPAGAPSAASVCNSASGHCTAWFTASGLPNTIPLAGVLRGSVDAVLGGPQAAGRLPDPVLVQEGLADLQAVVDLAEHRVGGHRTSLSSTSPWSLGMLKVHQ